MNQPCTLYEVLYSIILKIDILLLFCSCGICLNQDNQDKNDVQDRESCLIFVNLGYPDSDSVEKAHKIIGVDFEYL
ncbi:hypothetical protein MTBBW1_2320009 [Desulfamplus magnetovallimortis]|uniref:Uncharacterized protein n=1 Tax=Desulfamplus magnetovallimortis TaxID=1246637 RepID=A0A1W1HDT5_9BACT|nr:hypothetical protein MTBBW1_2320009 [Desulfamplus magnetovallimortis]